ncbi:hypothetical protein GCM10022225_56030 [Plantactinospora mayteni]|uniref:Uncharacterized protein n=1 Tax=Plantactinospora mayteni TaxID=566021 RepID=A0ABQ4EUL3_9ACTN|nr:hypothetical protein [Plantactinospora mayteni]GIG98360.1 hypothetical protein Pma05_49330 [Plantactinospora mayteni]
MRSENRSGDELPGETSPQPSTSGHHRADPPTTWPSDEAGRRLAAHAAVLAAASAARLDRLTQPSGTDPGQPEPLAALRLLGGLRAGLDEAERQLVEAARERRASWAQIATALGLASRQAAEQRWVRLSGAASRDPARVRSDRKRQQFVDNAYGVAITRLRAAVVAVHRQLGAEPDRDDWHPRARLARTTLGLAGSADPGALYALAIQAVDDLDEVPAEQFRGALPDALDRLRRALDQAAPTTAQPAKHRNAGHELSQPD